jgi:hypothetical protein
MGINGARLTAAVNAESSQRRVYAGATATAASNLLAMQHWCHMYLLEVLPNALHLSLCLTSLAIRFIPDA